MVDFPIVVQPGNVFPDDVTVTIIDDLITETMSEGVQFLFRSDNPRVDVTLPGFFRIVDDDCKLFATYVSSQLLKHIF